MLSLSFPLNPLSQSLCRLLFLRPITCRQLSAGPGASRLPARSCRCVTPGGAGSPGHGPGGSVHPSGLSPAGIPGALRVPRLPPTLQGGVLPVLAGTPARRRQS